MYLIHLSISSAAVYGAPASGGITRTATCTPRGGGTTAATTGSSTATCTLCGGGATTRNSTATVTYTPRGGGTSAGGTCILRRGSTTTATAGNRTATCTQCGGGGTTRKSTAIAAVTAAATGVLLFLSLCQTLRPALRQLFLSKCLGLLRFLPLDLWKIYKKQSTINRGTTTMKHTQAGNNF